MGNLCVQFSNDSDDMKRVNVELCADFAVSAAARRSTLVGGGPSRPKQPTTWLAQFFNSLLCFKSFSVENLRYEDVHVQQLFIAFVWSYKE